MNQNTIKVLLADDNKDFCDIIVDHLNKQEDITVVAVAMDGIDAMNKIRDTHPDVAVIDGIMPRLDGLGVLERLQKTEEDDRPITIILSALSQDKVVQKALDLGASYYMVKPFDMDALTQRIRQLMQEQKPQNATAALTGASNDSFYDKNRGRTKEARLKKITFVCSVILFVLILFMDIVMPLLTK